MNRQLVSIPLILALVTGFAPQVAAGAPTASIVDAVTTSAGSSRTPVAVLAGARATVSDGTTIVSSEDSDVPTAKPTSTPIPMLTPTLSAPSFVPSSTTASRRYRGKVIRGVAPNKGVRAIAVCFDDGPGTYRKRLVAICVKYHVAATFYDVESRETSQAVAYTTAAGCEVESHTDHHVSFVGQSSSRVTSRLTSSQKGFAALGIIPQYVRFPYNSVRPGNMSQIAALGLVYTGQYAMTHDYLGISVDKIVAKYVSMPNGSIVLSHDYTRNEPAAFERYVKYCKSHGIHLVTVSALLSEQGTPVTKISRATHRIKKRGHWVRVKYWKYTRA